MKYVGTIYKEVIIAKGISYIDFVAEDEIELSEHQYNTIPIPCELVDGEFIACDFPEIDIENIKITSDVAKITTGDYSGNGESGSEAVLIPCDKQPKLIVITGGKRDNNPNTADNDKGMLAIAVLKESGNYYCFGCYDEAAMGSDRGAEIDYITINYDDGFLKLDTRNSRLGDSINHSARAYYYALLY